MLAGTREDAMPYSREHRDQTRARIVQSARTLFNRRGFEVVKIDDVMAHAGLTRGGFYNYFETKGQLYAEAVTLSLAETPWARWDGVTVDFSAKNAAQQVIHAYLSQQHLDDVDGSCPMVALPTDVARSEQKVRLAFEKVFNSMAGLFEKTLEDEGRPDRKRALAIASICVGAMVVARAMDSADLRDAIRDAAMKTALDLGGWRDGVNVDGGRARSATSGSRKAAQVRKRRNATSR
jgi:AcrR family transcriptional regulator